MAYEREYKVTKSTNDLYKFYKDRSNDPLSESDFKNIYYELNKNISDLIITKAFEYRLPHRLGYLRIKKRKLRIKIKDGKIVVNKNMIDWKETLDYWEDTYGTRDKMELKNIPNKKRIYQLNEHTDGDIMSWFWNSSFSPVHNVTVYKFKPVKGGIVDDYYYGRLGLTELIKTGNYDYYY